MKTRLDVYKEAWKKEHDGAVVLEAAERGVAFSTIKQRGDHPAVLLIRIGVRAEMTRQSIIDCLAKNIALENPEASEILDDEIQRRLPIKVTPLPGVKDKIKEDAVGWLRGFIEEVMTFCQEEVVSGEIKKEERRAANKKGFFDFLRNVLK